MNVTLGECKSMSDAPLCPSFLPSFLPSMQMLIFLTKVRLEIFLSCIFYSARQAWE